jgi:hypothetical protein
MACEEHDAGRSIPHMKGASTGHVAAPEIGLHRADEVKKEERWMSMSVLD